jgi:DNA-directed RNA polymerase specialized sigma24 family protein
MPSSQTIATYLPFLRRYARALAGDQASGDTYVVATLEALLEEPTSLNDDLAPRVGLFQLFTRIWNSVGINNSTDEAVGAPKREDWRLSHITPLPRQAFLLVSLEGFSEQEAAQILDIDVEAHRKLVEEAGRELARDIATRVLIIEDESLIAADLEYLVSNLGHQIVGTARTHAQAIAIAKVKQPGLILADIQLADGSSGLEAVNELLNSINVPVIFITAYPERFLTGQRPEPAFLISKPYAPAMVSAIVSQALFFQRNATPRKRASIA